MAGTPPQSSLILYQTEDGRTRIQCRFYDETVWLTQRLIADLFDVSVKTANEHLVNIYGDGELQAAATIRNFRIVQNEGSRQVARNVDHYNLRAKAEGEYESYKKNLDAQPRAIDAAFEAAAKKIKNLPKPRKPKK